MHAPANTVAATASPVPVPQLRTVLLCDLVESTALIERLGDGPAAELMRRHDRLAREAMARHGGREIDKTDGFLVLFERPIHGVAFALDYQRLLRGLGDQVGQPLRARVGIHVGDVLLWDNAAAAIAAGAKPVEVEGLAKSVAARLMGLARAGQILLSETAHSIAQRAHGELGDDGARVQWRSHGRYRFKGVPQPQQVFEVGIDGESPLQAPPSGDKARALLPWWRWRSLHVALAIVVLVALSVPVYRMLQPEPTLAFAERDWVVVGQLRNLTTEPRFDDALYTAVRVGLEQSRYVNVIPELQVRDALQRMDRDPAAAKVDRELGAEIAQREGARALLLPTVAEVGGRVRVTIEVVDPQSQATVYSESADGSGAESALTSTDIVLQRLRERLGESMEHIQEAALPLAKVTTGDLDALRAYSLAMQALVSGDNKTAQAMVEQAVELDPGFAAAYLQLSVMHYSTGRRAKAREYALLTARNPERLSARERLIADGFIGFFDQLDAAQEKWALFVRLYPDVMGGQQSLGLSLWWFDNDAEGATEHFAIVANSRDPKRGYGWLMLANTQLATEQYDKAADSYAKARDAGGAMQAFLDPAFLPLARRDEHGAEAAIAAETTGGYPFFEVEKQLRLSALEVVRGNLPRAREFAIGAAELAQKSELPTSMQRSRLAAAAIAFADGHPSGRELLTAVVDDEIVRLHASEETLERSPYAHLALAAMLALRNGERALADRALAALAPYATRATVTSLTQPYQIAECESRIERDADDAVRCLQALQGPNSYFQTEVALLRAQLAAGQQEAALATAAWLDRNRGRATAEWMVDFASQIPNLLASDAARALVNGPTDPSGTVTQAHATDDKD